MNLIILMIGLCALIPWETSCAYWQRTSSSPIHDDYPLHDAIKNNTHGKNNQFIASLIDAGADVNERDGCEITPLQLACKYNNYSLAKILLDNGAKHSINRRSEQGKTPLHFACKRNNYSLAELLLNNGAAKTINTRPCEGYCPLFYAAIRHQNEKLTAKLLQSGAHKSIKSMSSYYWDVDAFRLVRDGYCAENKKASLLHLAVILQREAILDVLLKSGGSRYINLKDQEHGTPLYLALKLFSNQISNRKICYGYRLHKEIIPCQVNSNAALRIILILLDYNADPLIPCFSKNAYQLGQRCLGKEGKEKLQLATVRNKAKNRKVAFLAGMQPRLGKNSPVLQLDNMLVYNILSFKGI